MKKLNDYLHLYLGCDVVIRDFATAKLIGVSEDHFYVEGKPHNHFYISKGVQPILRPLSDMTKEESEAVKNMAKHGGLYENCAEITRHLLSKHFDLFGLIKAGLAIKKQ